MSLVSDAVLTNNPPTKAGYETVKNDFDTWKKSSTELVKLAEAEESLNTQNHPIECRKCLTLS